MAEEEEDMFAGMLDAQFEAMLPNSDGDDSDDDDSSVSNLYDEEEAIASAGCSSHLSSDSAAGPANESGGAPAGAAFLASVAQTRYHAMSSPNIHRGQPKRGRGDPGSSSRFHNERTEILWAGWHALEAGLQEEHMDIGVGHQPARGNNHK